LTHSKVLLVDDYTVNTVIAGAQKRLRNRLPDVAPVHLKKLLDNIPKSLEEHSSESLFRTAQLHGALLFRQYFYVNPLFERSVSTTWSPTTSPGSGDHTTSTTTDVHLRHFRIKNVRAFGDFLVEHRVPENGSGQWTLLLGDNGVGKTTILRALVLALSGRRTADALLRLQGASAPLLRTGEDHGSVEVKLDGRTFRVELSRDDRGIETIDGDSENPFPVYAYGCQRGTALGGRNREADPTRPLEDVLTLFDPSANMIHAETWLRERQRVALQPKDKSEKAFYEAVLQTVQGSLEGIDKVTVERTGVWLEGPAVGRARLAALSDAYITMVGWLLDLIARWADRARRLGIAIDGDFREAMTGIVLLDEIDLHLHPLWQVSVVSDLRRLFPRLSFVATTHNPLTLLGAREGEVHVLRKDAGGRVVSMQRDIPKGARADQILTGEWFGLTSTLDPETVEMLDRHRDMLRRQVPRDDEERRKLEEDLRERLGTFEDTSLEGMVRGIMADLTPRDFKESSPEERRAIREKILAEARKHKRVV
jgi:energy-coupling factor transporter ATP-binding protein EcfA2